MTGLEFLDLPSFTNEAMTPDPLNDYRPREDEDPWLRRRAYAFGGSELAPLLFAYGLAPLSASPPAWVIEQAEHYKALGLPKILAWKAGLRGRPKGDVKSQEIGAKRERELLGRYRATMARRWVRPETIRHADTVPREFFPLVDRFCHRIAVTPDAWARSAKDGALVTISLKCKFFGALGVPWHDSVQLQAEIGCMECVGGVYVVGENWVDERLPDGPVRAFPVVPDKEAIGLNRAVAAEAWALVEQLRGAKSVKDCAALWEASAARMEAFKSPESRALEQALASVDDLDAHTDFAA